MPSDTEASDRPQPEPLPAPATWTIGLIGYGEVGRIFAEELAAAGVAVVAYDLRLSQPADRGAQTMRDHAAAHGTRLLEGHSQVAKVADLVISAVTASQAVPVARACASGMRDRGFFLDVNSASPGAKRLAASVIDAAGGRYVEGAVMTSVPPLRLRVPLLLGGPHAAALLEPLNHLGFEANLASNSLGVASATKMCRSIMIKGLEAMMIESLSTARAYGVEDAVIASLYETFPGVDWERQAAYFFQRVIEHGRRRSEEVMEVAQTVREVGLTPWSASGTAKRQAWVADLADQQVFGVRGEAGFARSPDWRIEADRLLAHTSRNLHHGTTP